jgi:hypothetical protein
MKPEGRHEKAIRLLGQRTEAGRKVKSGNVGRLFEKIGDGS